MLISQKLNNVNRQLLIIFIFSISLNLYGQDSISNNSVSLFVIPVPNRLFLATISYERFFNRKNSIEITGKYYSFSSSSYTYENDFEKMIFAEPAYRHYLYSKKDAKNISWVSVYFSIYSDKWKYVSYSHFGGHSDSGKKINYGLGAVVGRRLVFGKLNKIFLDVGIGGAYYIKRISEKESIAPRIVFRFGYRFA